MSRLLNVDSNLIDLRSIFENPLYKKLVMLMYLLSFLLLEIFRACLNTKLVEMLYTSINTVCEDGAPSFSSYILKYCTNFKTK